MNDIITISNSEIQVKEYQGVRVVTLKDVDTAHGRPEGTARKRFNDNRVHFIEDEDYFKVKCGDVRPFFGQTPPNGFNPDAALILLTESGYLMLVKSFTDDLAWKVQRQLVNTYFRAKEVAQQAKPMTAMQMLELQVQVNKELSDRIDVLENNQKRIAEACSVPAVGRDEWQENMKKYLSGLCEEYSMSYPVMYDDLYGALERKVGCDLDRRQSNMRKRLKDAGATYKERQSVSKLTVIAKDPSLTGVFEGIVQRYAAHLASRKWETA